MSEFKFYVMKNNLQQSIVFSLLAQQMICIDIQACKVHVRILLFLLQIAAIQL
jgi:hypothetical protein